MRTIAAGASPTVSDNGRYVAYVGKSKRDLYVWDRKSDDTELITVGPSGDGSGGRLDVPDISPDGRWIVAAIDDFSVGSANIAPDNGRRYARNGIVLFDREAAPR